MAKVFSGFDEPTENWSKLPHALVETMHLMTSQAEIKVVLYILRHTWGFGDDEKKITIDEFCNGRKRRDGSRLDAGTGLSTNAVKAGIASAVDHGFIRVVEDDSDKARIKRYYQLRNSGGQKLTPWGSEVDPLLSEVDPRTEKETLRKKPKKEQKTSGDLSPGPKTVIKEEFCRLTGIAMPGIKSQQGFWWSQFGEILRVCGDADKATLIMASVVKKMRDDDLTISGPQSIVNMCRSRVAGQSPAANNGRHPPGPDITLNEAGETVLRIG